MKRVLTIDGGGIRGILPAALLTALEARNGVPVARAYDLLAGTSTGGIIATGLACHVPAAELLALYQNHGPAIFDESLVDKVEGGFGAFGAKYHPAPLESQLTILGDAWLSDPLACELLVPTY